MELKKENKMKFFYNIFMILTLVNFIQSKELELGSEIPLSEIKMDQVDGNAISLKDAMGKKGLIVIFSCNTCPWVLAWEDRYNIVYKKYRDKGIDMIVINSNQGTRNSVDSMSDMKKHAKKAKYEFSYTLDKESKLASAFGATKTPHVYLFNSEGKLVYRGAIDDNSRNPKKVEDNYLMDALDSMIEGKNISTVSTKALGCTIKFVDN